MNKKSKDPAFLPAYERKELPSPQPNPSEEKPPSSANKRRNIIFAMAAFFLLIGLIYLIYYLIWGQFHVTTDDAYINGNRILLNARVSSNVTKIYAEETELVAEGQLLIELDPTDYLIEFEAKKTILANVLRQTIEFFENVDELEAQLAKYQAELVRATQDFEHRLNLIESGSVSLEDVEHTEAALKVAFSNVNYTSHLLNAARAKIQNTTVTTHPQVKKVKDDLLEAWVKLQRCQIFAPATGIVAQRKIQVGEHVSPSDPLLSVVPLNQIWAEANFKEIQLKHIRIGQPVKVTADIYGGSVDYHGTVVGLTAGTGSVFSALPPQNATGNWIKIVQRLAVRIKLNCEQIKKHPLFLP